MPEERADLRAALIARFAGQRHKLDLPELMAWRWRPVIDESFKPRGKRAKPRGRKKQSSAQMAATFAQAAAAHNRGRR